MSIYVNTNPQTASEDYHHAFIVAPNSGNIWLQKCIYRDSNGEMCLASPNLFCNAFTSTAYPERNRVNFQPSTIRCHKDSFCLSNEGTLFMYFRTDTKPNMSDKPYIGFAMYSSSSRSVELNGNTTVIDFMSGGNYFAVSPINASDDSIYLSTMEFIKPTLTATYNGIESIVSSTGPLNAYELVLKRPSDLQRTDIPDDYNGWRPSSSYGSSYPYYSVRFIISTPSDWPQITQVLVPYLMRQETTASIRYNFNDSRIAFKSPTVYVKKIKDRYSRSYWLVDVLCPAVGYLEVAASYYHAYIPYIVISNPPSSGELYIHDMQMTIRLTDSIRSSAT